MITARSRRLLLEALREADEGGNVYYCDTDSVICDAILKTSKALGGLKLERRIEEGIFTGAKLYAMKEREEDWLARPEKDRGRRELIKAKGFSSIVSEGGSREPLSYASFVSLGEGHAVTVERMLRIRELLRTEGTDYSPRSVRQLKQLGAKRGKYEPREMPKPKRKPQAGGDSIPWDWKEVAG